MPTIFTQIISGEIPGYFVWRDDKCVAFLSINPVKSGHCLVVPIQEVDHWLEANDIGHLAEVAQHIGKALEEIYKPNRVGMMIAGFEINHTHLHVMCTDDMDDMDLINASSNVDPAELNTTAEKIRNVLISHGHKSVAKD